MRQFVCSKITRHKTIKIMANAVKYTIIPLRPSHGRMGVLLQALLIASACKNTRQNTPIIYRRLVTGFNSGISGPARDQLIKE
mgnify:FL=1